MVLGALKVEIHIPESGSLKSKRRVLRSIKDQIRGKFNVSLSEVEYQDTWQRSLIAIAMVGTDKRFINQVFDKILNLLETISEIQILDQDIEIE